jgi:radical SAM protein with 4Fe4S-binding SPASM domain
VLSPEETSAVVDILGEVGVFSITFTGGEPLLSMESVLAGLAACEKWGIESSLNSNLTTASIDKLVEFKRKGLQGILTSLMSCEEDLHDELVGRKGAFRQTIEGIKMAKLAGLRVSVNMVVSRKNLHSVYETGMFCRRELGIDSFAATRMGPSSYNLSWFRQYKLSPKELRFMLDQLLKLKGDSGIQVDSLQPLPFCELQDIEKYRIFTKRSCAGGVVMCTIGADGGVRPCSHMDVVYGNIFEEGFEEAWNSLEEWRKGILVPKECWDCEYVVNCKGGCRMFDKYDKEDVQEIRQKGSVIFKKTSGFEEDLHVREEIDKLVDANTPLAFNSSVKFREEEFGGAIAVRGRSPFLVNRDSFELLRSLAQKRSFTLKSVAEELELSIDEVKPFFLSLFKRGVIVKADSEVIILRN